MERVLKVNDIEKEIFRLLSAIEYSRTFFSKLSNYVLSITTLLILLTHFSTKTFFVIGIGIAIWYLCEFIKGKFVRVRPYEVMGKKVKTKTKPERSFPSSHSAVAFYYFLSFYSTTSFSFLYLFVPIFRILSFQHWLSDVLFSFFMAILFRLIYP